MPVFCPENCVYLLTCCIYSIDLRGDLIMEVEEEEEVNTINPDQTASREQSDLGRYWSS